MIEHELEHEGYDAATHFLAELPEPRPDLEERVAELGRELESREQEYRDLQRQRYEADVDVGRHGRSLFLLVLVVLTALVNLVPYFWPAMTGYAADMQVEIGVFTGYIVAVGGLVYRARDSLAQNEANRRMMAMMGMILAMQITLRVVDMLAGTPRFGVEMHKSLNTATGILVAAATIDMRFLWLAIPILATLPLQYAMPEYALLVSGGGFTVGGVLLARVWWEESAC
ncbi:MAG: hypothetical protein ABEL76_09150 [Bradymonadaceae bacterium]